MQMQDWMGPVELSVPCHRRMMLVVRMTVAGVASRFGLTLDDMDDLKMAVEEACHSMMLQARPFAQLKLRFYFDEEKALKITVSGQGERSESQEGARMEICTLEVMRCILESMVDGVEFAQDAQGLCSVELMKNIALDA